VNTYLSTFVPGFEDLIKDLLQKKFPNSKVIDVYSGAILYKDDHSPEKIKQIKFFNNTFLVFKYWKGGARIEEIVQDTENILSQQSSIHPELLHKAKTFRVIYSVENTMVSLESNLYQKLSNSIYSNLQLKFGGPKSDLEFWLLTRNEGLSVFGMRITKGLPQEKGALSSEVSYILNFLSDAEKSDVFLDPFAGSGSIPLERYYNKGFKAINAGDIADEKIAMMRKRFNKALATKINIQKINALSLPFQDKSIDKIVTDPPWGTFSDLKEDPELFYKKILSEFSRVLKKDGILVLLVARKISIYDPNFTLLKKYEILLSGQKASVYKLKNVS
jgi:tRNA (guanine6-N2)-methyltransferase